MLYLPDKVTNSPIIERGGSKRQREYRGRVQREELKDTIRSLLAGFQITSTFAFLFESVK
jgi:hypothetical protein